MRVQFNRTIKSYEITILYSIITIMPFSIVFFEKINILDKNYAFYSYLVLTIFLLLLTSIEIITKKPYLALIFGCHNLCERSFKIKDYYLPICARCSGIYLGVFLSFSKVTLEYNFVVSVMLMIPLLIDGLVQRYTRYNSNNSKRFISGILFGIASIDLFLLMVYTNEKMFDFFFNLIF